MQTRPPIVLRNGEAFSDRTSKAVGLQMFSDESRDRNCVVIDGHGHVWDLDTKLTVPIPVDDWLTKSLPLAPRLPAHIAPRFRLIPADDYRQEFGSDRSHMRDNDGTWTRPPPPWSRIGSGMKLPDYRNVSTDGPPGRLLDLAGLLDR